MKNCSDIAIVAVVEAQFSYWYASVNRMSRKLRKFSCVLAARGSSVGGGAAFYLYFVSRSLVRVPTMADQT